MIDYSDIDKMNKTELEEFISYAETQKHKADKLQHAVKILLKSLYGATSYANLEFLSSS